MAIIRVKAKDAAGDLAAFKALGMENTARKILQSSIAQLSQVAQNACQTVVPIDTAELRKSIKIETISDMEKAIDISDSPRSYGQYSNPQLVEILENPKYHRRKESGLSGDLFDRIDKGALTAGWRENAQVQFIRYVRAKNAQ